MTLTDATLLWLRSTAARARQTFRRLTGPEIRLTGALIGLLVGVLFLVIAIPDSSYLWITFIVTATVAVLLVPPVLADAVILRENLRISHAAMLRTNAAKPTGAPRVAEVQCKHGDAHRFVYGPTGWESAGPAVHAQLDQEASTS